MATSRDEWVTPKELAALTEHTDYSQSPQLPKSGVLPKLPVVMGDREIGRKPGRPGIYPWQIWTDGKYHIIECLTAQVPRSVEAMRIRILKRASLEGLYCWTQSLGDNELGFQYFKTEKEKLAAQVQQREDEFDAQNMEGEPEDGTD